MVAGAVGVVLAGAGLFLILVRSERPASSSQVEGSAVAAPSEPGATPSPVAATLYNQVMMASETGDAAEAKRLAPDALRAYRALGPLGSDGHYHVGLLQLTAGEIAAAKAEREAIRAVDPDHLLGIMLEHTIALQTGEDGLAAAATRSFLAVYDGETAAGRDEYLEHRVGLERFLERAQTIGR
jgi:hypothetical protein